MLQPAFGSRKLLATYAFSRETCAVAEVSTWCLLIVAVKLEILFLSDAQNRLFQRIKTFLAHN